MENKDLEKQYSFSNKQVLGMVAGVAFTVFSLTTIYNKFLFQGEEIIVNSTAIKELKEAVVELEKNKAPNDRLDKKTKRIEEQVNTMSKDVEALKEPDSDRQ